MSWLALILLDRPASSSCNCQTWRVIIHDLAEYYTRMPSHAKRDF